MMQPSRMVLLVQKEVAKRIVAADGKGKYPIFVGQGVW